MSGCGQLEPTERDCLGVPGKRYTPEQTIGRLRETEVEPALLAIRAGDDVVADADTGDVAALPGGDGGPMPVGEPVNATVGVLQGDEDARLVGVAVPIAGLFSAVMAPCPLLAPHLLGSRLGTSRMSASFLVPPKEMKLLRGPIWTLPPRRSPSLMWYLFRSKAQRVIWPSSRHPPQAIPMDGLPARP